ncbi:hypothetical protein O181_095815 [Austropuccinia psidii MF-1]|uniref:Uncharacterized protein n=1 Tax=Austropuccinia psidii MF-1 TaxID=1389203 RepID=A0A9Q3PCF4_9BASI|nr:hypothetical protein [Austropuccinia psidii MF-1]
MTSNSSLDQIPLREACSLRRDAAKIINDSLPTTSTRQNYFPMPTTHTQNPSSGSVEIPSFDADYIPTSEIPSELDISVTGALRSEEGLALSKLGLTYGGLKDMIRKSTPKSARDELLE